MESQILFFIQDCVRSAFLDWIFIPATHLGDGGAVWIVATVLMLCFKKTRSAGIACAFALVIMLVINNLTLKVLIDRQRPYLVLENLRLLVKPAVDSSFPSGHTSASFAFTAAVFLSCGRKIWIPSLILAVLISLSRLYVGIHWPSDVLCGVILGCVYGAMGFFAAKKIVRTLGKSRESSDDSLSD